MIKQESCGTTETNKGKDYKDTFQYCFVSILWEKALTTKTLKIKKRKRGNTTCITRRHKLSTNKKMKKQTKNYTKVLQHAIQGDINDLQCAVARFRVLQVFHTHSLICKCFIHMHFILTRSSFHYHEQRWFISPQHSCINAAHTTN